jgi:hypothetical protein
MNYIDEFRSADFEKYLLESRLEGSSKEKFLVHWVRNFFEYWLKLPNLSWPEQLQPPY